MSVRVAAPCSHDGGAGCGEGIDKSVGGEGGIRVRNMVSSFGEGHLARVGEDHPFLNAGWEPAWALAANGVGWNKTIWRDLAVRPPQQPRDFARSEGHAMDTGRILARPQHLGGAPVQQRAGKAKPESSRPNGGRRAGRAHCPIASGAEQPVCFDEVGSSLSSRTRQHRQRGCFANRNRFEHKADENRCAPT